MIEQLEALRDQALVAIARAGDRPALEAIRADYLSKKGKLGQVLRGMGALPADARPQVGKVANEVKEAIEQRLAEALERQARTELEAELGRRRIDPTLPGRPTALGHVHPVTLVLEEIVDILARLGFEVAGGPEVEHVWYNFEALNFPKDHPAMDMHDTFFVNDDVVLRTHTSPMQIRTMLKHGPPVRALLPGKVYRCDRDVSHSPMFTQIEGLWVDHRATFAELRGVVWEFVRRLFDPKTRIRFRPSFFPFTEPSAEVDISCFICAQKGCPACKHSGWIEVGGAGMVHPKVFASAGWDPEKVQGFAFGLGVERVAMLKYRIGDIKAFYQNDLRFLRQF